jgi:protocatechuate 3,4-dioxygenase beta subunit
VSGIDWTARLVRPTTFEHFDAADVQDILNRFAGSDEQVVISSGVNQPTTCVIRTRNARIGVLRITEQADEAGSITFQYRLAAVSPAAPPATGNSKGHQPVPPQKPEAAAPPAADATAVSGNYVFPIDVSGRALDADGKPIAGAVIFLGSQRADWKRVSETTTDEQGRYVFLQVPLPIERATTNSGRDTGAFEVFGFADGYAIAWRPKKTFFPDPEARNRNVIEDNPDDPPTWFVAGDRIELDLTFERPVSISGRILDDRGRPIPETSLDIRYADVEWDRPNYDSIQFHGALTSLNERETVPPEFKRRQADADGRFTYTGLRPDCRYQVWVRPPGFPLKRIWIVTKPGKTRDDNGLPIYGDGMELTFATPIDVPIRVIYDDTGEPAPKVHVHLGRADASASQSTNDQGEITLRIPPGEHRLDLDPAHGTPYLESDGTLDVPANTPDEPIVVRLKRGTMVEVVVVDVATGKGVPDVDLWHEAEYPQPIGLPAARARRVYEFRSWEVETRIAHVNRPRTDAGGHLRAVFPPGKHRIGIGLESYPQGSRVVESNGREIDCKAGETVTVTFHLQPR